VITYEQITGQVGDNVVDARNFIGNEQLGFKAAICERDTGIYGSMLLFGLVFSFFRKKIKSIPWYLWVIIGVLPMGLDGGSQLPSLIANLPAWVPIRESTPFLRVLTGSLFGITTAWYLYPLLEESMSENRQLMKRKFATVAQLAKGGK